MEHRCIKSIFFDLGMVLVDVDYRIAAREVARYCDKTPEDIYAVFFNTPLTNRFEAGRISTPRFFSTIKHRLGLRISYKEFLPIWNSIFTVTEENRTVWRIAKRLMPAYRVAVVSNINALHYHHLKKLPILKAIPVMVSSFQVGVLKPHPAIYRKALRMVASRPEECFYTDDRTELIERARTMGLHSFVFKNAALLQRDLAACGVIV